MTGTAEDWAKFRQRTSQDDVELAKKKWAKQPVIEQQKAIRRSAMSKATEVWTKFDKVARQVTERALVKEPCSNRLLWFRDWLKKQIPDESMASMDYKTASNNFSGLRDEPESVRVMLTKFAGTLMTMSGDESRHKQFLEETVKFITEKCGK